VWTKTTAACLANSPSVKMLGSSDATTWNPFLAPRSVIALTASGIDA
jgi:hypothetical protein